MTEGVWVELKELIALQGCAQRVKYKPKGAALKAGSHLSKVRGRGMDFAEVRNYQAGDEVRHMEWRITARTGRPHVKLFQEERERPVVLLMDFNPSMYFGTRHAFKSVVAAQLAAIIAWTVVKQGDRIGGLLSSAETHDEFVPRAREKAVLPLLAALSDYTKKMNGHHQAARLLSDSLIRIRRVVRPGSIIVIISDFYTMDADSIKHLSRLRSHNDILAYQITDPLEIAPPKPQQYSLTNGGHTLLLDTGIDSISKAYQEYCEQRQGVLQGDFDRLLIPCTQVSVEADLPSLVRQTFPGRSHA